MKVLESHGLIDALDASSKRVAFSLPYFWVKPIVFGLDVLVVALTGVAVGAGYSYLTHGSMGVAATYACVGALIQLYAGAMLAVRGGYEVNRLTAFPTQWRQFCAVWSAVFAVWLVGLLAIKLSDAPPRESILLFGIAGLGTMVGWRYLVALYLAWALASGRFMERRVVVVGEHDLISNAGILANLRRVGYRPVQVVTLGRTALDNPDHATAMQAMIDTVVAAARDHDSRVDEVVLVFGAGRAGQILHLLEALKVVSIPVRLIPDEFTSGLLERSKVKVGGVWSTELQRGPLTSTDVAIKYAIDATVALTALLLLSPLLLIVAALVKLESRGPVFFKQTRNGFNGRTFRIYKFRSMSVLEDGAVIRQATRGDRRVTRIGRWLRRTSIDEVPQLLNVLRGDMSIVGPRPHAVAHNTEYEQAIAQYAFRHHVKPGITGWAQVNGFRGETSTLDHMVSRVELDIWYIKNWRHSLDVKIMLRTLLLLASPTAY